jgi:hypothetical protein
VPANGVFVGAGVFGVAVGAGDVGVGLGGAGVGVGGFGVDPSPGVGVGLGGVPVTTGVGVIGYGFGKVGVAVGVPAKGVEVGVGVKIPLPGSVGVWQPGSQEHRIPIASALQRIVPRLRLKGSHAAFPIVAHRTSMHVESLYGRGPQRFEMMARIAAP